MRSRRLRTSPCATASSWKQADLDECAAWGTYTLDDRYADAVLIPGLIESHGHQSEGQNWDYPYVGAIERFGPDGKRRPALRSVAAVVAALQPIERSMADPNQTLVAWNADPSFYSTPAPITCHDLDQVSATRPILVTNASGHILYANSKVLQMANYAANHAPGVMRDANGQLTGELQEMAAMVPAILAAAPQLLGAKPSPRPFLELRPRLCLARGHHRQRRRPRRVLRSPVLRRGGSGHGRSCLSGAHRGPPQRHHRHQGRGDPGACGGPGRQGQRQADLPGRQVHRRRLDSGLYRAPAPALLLQDRRQRPLEPFARGTHGAGRHHACRRPPGCLPLQRRPGRRGVHRRRGGRAGGKPRFDHRHFIVHGQMLDEALLRRMAALGIGATMFANHLYYWGDFHYSQTVGPSRAQGFSPLATALRLGVGVSTHSDTPVSPIDPLFSAWCAANRVTSSGRVLGADERLSVLDALKLVTINAAWLLHRDHEIGQHPGGQARRLYRAGGRPLGSCRRGTEGCAGAWHRAGRAARRLVMEKAAISVSIPVTVIGGYLGSGKTTLLNALLRGDHGRRLAVLVNDFGSINIDADLITAHGGDTISLANGCICCSLQDNLGATLYDLATRSDPPDQIVIEASGVADPGRIGHYARSLARAAPRRSHRGGRCRGDSPAGARQVCGRHRAAAAGSRRPARAHQDRPARTPAVQEVQRWLAAQAPGVPVVEVVGGQAPPALILGLRGRTCRR